jgi:alkylhydroperoxidase family enzyme
MVTLNKVDDDLRDKLQKHFTDEAIVELTAIAAFQNMSAKFNSALKVESNNLCKRE